MTHLQGQTVYIAYQCIENTKSVSFDIKFTRQGFKNASLIPRLALQPRDSTCVLKAEPGKLDIKYANLVFYLSVHKLIHSSN